jgi:hypothetical protein
LAQNALRHTSSRTHIFIRLIGESEMGVRLSIEDGEPGVAAIDLPSSLDVMEPGLGVYLAFPWWRSALLSASRAGCCRRAPPEEGRARR